MRIRMHHALLSSFILAILTSTGSSIPTCFFKGPFVNIPGESWSIGGQASVHGTGRTESLFLPFEGIFFVYVSAEYQCFNGNTVSSQAQLGPVAPFFYIDSYGASWAVFGWRPVMTTLTPGVATCDIFASTTSIPPSFQMFPENCTLYDPDSPIVLDIDGDGFDLTNFANGVMFDLDRDGIAEQLSWTSADSDDAWLALDRNENGTIDNGNELFGNHTNQPAPPPGEERNGFALAVFDRPSKGGNNDGKINRQDDVFDRLRLWQDANHNGISEISELMTLPQLGLASIDLDYRESQRTDEHGNRFKYKAKIRDSQDAQLGRWAWDVFLKSAP